MDVCISLCGWLKQSMDWTPCMHQKASHVLEYCTSAAVSIVQAEVAASHVLWVEDTGQTKWTSHDSHQLVAAVLLWSKDKKNTVMILLPWTATCFISWSCLRLLVVDGLLRRNYTTSSKSVSINHNITPGVPMFKWSYKEHHCPPRDSIQILVCQGSIQNCSSLLQITVVLLPSQTVDINPQH